MGLRPHFMLLCGIVDLKLDAEAIFDLVQNYDIALPAKLELSASPDHDELQAALKISTIRHWLGEASAPTYKVVEYDPEFGLPNVIGIRIDDHYDHDILWAMALIDPVYTEPGFKLIPSIPLEEDHSEGAIELRYGLYDDEQPSRAALCKKARIEAGHNYGMGFASRMDSWLDVAGYVFEQLSIPVSKTELKLFLYWKWS